MEKEDSNSYKLLDMTGSDSDFELPEFLVKPSPRKRRLKKRKGLSLKTPAHRPECWWSGRMFGLIFLSGVLFCWIVTLTWFIIILHSELRRLDFNVISVVAGNQGIPDALQKCHSLSRELQQNQTDLRNKLNLLTLQLTNFSKQMTAVGSGLLNVEQKLKASPELVDVPQMMRNLFKNVAALGSKVGDCESTTAALKQTSQNLASAQKVLKSNVTSIKESLLTLKSATNPIDPETEKQRNEEKQKVLNLLQKLDQNLTNVNETLTEKLHWAVEEQAKDHSAIESLQDISQNVSAQVTTLQEECSSKVLKSLSTSVQSLESELKNSSNRINKIESKMMKLTYLSDQDEVHHNHNDLDTFSNSSNQSNSNLTNVWNDNQ